MRFGYDVYVGKIILFALAIALIVLAGLKLGKVYVKYNRLKVENGVLQAHSDSLYGANAQLLRAWTNTVSKTGVEYNWVFYGNSITRNSDFGKYFEDKKILNLGLGADDLKGMARRANMLGRVSCEKVFLMAGINSVQKLSDNDFVEAYIVLLDSVLTYVEKDDLIVQNMLPISASIENDCFSNKRIETLNEKIRVLCAERNIRYLDLYHLYVEDGVLPVEKTMGGDGLHIKAEEYALWADAIATACAN